MTYRQSKDWIEHMLALPDAALHIHAGLIILFIARLFMRRRLGTFVPFLFVCFAAIANEILDRSAFGSWRWQDSLGDIANTLLWPFVISLVAAFRQIERTDETAGQYCSPSDSDIAVAE